MEQLELFPLSFGDHALKRQEEILLLERDVAINEAHCNYENATSLQLANPIGYGWWWHATSWDYVEQYYPGFLERQGLR